MEVETEEDPVSVLHAHLDEFKAGFMQDLMDAFKRELKAREACAIREFRKMCKYG